jgi:DNA-directed RNA polymerase beta' subunit
MSFSIFKIGSEDEGLSCPNCGVTISTRECKLCGRHFRKSTKIVCFSEDIDITNEYIHSRFDETPNRKIREHKCAVCLGPEAVEAVL